MIRQRDVHITLIARHRVCSLTTEEMVGTVFTELLYQQSEPSTEVVHCEVEIAPLGTKSTRRDLRILIEGEHGVYADQFLDRLLLAAPELKTLVVSANMGPGYVGMPLYAHATRQAQPK